jgi:hypothetical protein
MQSLYFIMLFKVSVLLLNFLLIFFVFLLLNIIFLLILLILDYIFVIFKIIIFFFFNIFTLIYLIFQEKKTLSSLSILEILNFLLNHYIIKLGCLLLVFLILFRCLNVIVHHLDLRSRKWRHK